MAFRVAAESFRARAFPPFNPPSLPKATAAAFFDWFPLSGMRGTCHISTLMGNVSQNIVGLRVKQGRLAFKPSLTQAALSKKLAKLGVSIDRAGIAKIETGIRGVLDFEVVALAKVLRVKVTWLVGARE
jgi:hypothetical protein